MYKFRVFLESDIFINGELDKGEAWKQAQEKAEKLRQGLSNSYLNKLILVKDNGGVYVMEEGGKDE